MQKHKNSGLHKNIVCQAQSVSVLDIIAMDFVSSNRSLLGFNLSFFVKDIELLPTFYNQISDWLDQDKLKIPRIVEMDMQDIGQAHELIQSGKSVGKIVIQTNIKID